MSTKNNPGPVDCYAKAEPDEPMFVLLGRDRHAPELVLRWAAMRAAEGEDRAVTHEAVEVAAAMKRFRDQRTPIPTVNGTDEPPNAIPAGVIPSDAGRRDYEQMANALAEKMAFALWTDRQPSFSKFLADAPAMLAAALREAVREAGGRVELVEREE